MITISKFSNTVEYNLKTSFDASGINQLQGQIAALSAELDRMSAKKLIDTSSFNTAKKDIETLQKALSSAFNGDKSHTL